MFIMVDGIDGSGKSTVVESWKEFLKKEGNTIFDLKEYWKQNGKHPDYSELKSYDFIFSCEPTYAPIGKTIRDEFIKNGNNYPPLATAEAYSLDRLVLYNKLIIPALKEGKCVIQDRGVSTSLCYQPITDSEIISEIIQNLPGNAVALQNAPNHLILFTIDPKISLERVGSRTNKLDDAIFEKLDFLTKAANVFASPEYKQIFTSHGTTVHYLPSEAGLDIMNERSLVLLKQLLYK